MVNWEKELNQEQLEAVQHDDGPLLVLAGAGSGKTRVLTYRVAWLIENKGIRAEKMLLLTFTNKAAGEMRERVERLVGKQIGFAGTFHSFCASILRRYGNAIGLANNFVIYDETDRKDLFKMIFKELNIDEKIIKLPAVAAMISNAKNEMLGWSEYGGMARGQMQKQVALVWSVYQRKLAEYGAVDFDDMLILGVRLLEDESVRNALCEEYEYVLVDEYQDTNKAQYLLTKLLVNGRSNLTVVGDFSQSIYSWRGADFRNLNYLDKDFGGLKTVKLEQNYRSTQNILDAAYGVIGKNVGHPILELKAIQVAGERIKTFEANDEREEAGFVIEKIRGFDYNRFAVLYRTNAQSRSLEEAFIKAGVPYVLVGGVKFYERKEVKDVLAYLRVIANNKDMVSWRRIEKNGKRRRQIFEGWLASANLEGKSTEQIMAVVLENSGYLEKFDRNDEADLTRLENIQELMSVAKEFPELSGFLENVALVQSEAQSKLDLDAGKVTLMTMHAAKGLEFDEVFVVGLEEGLFPHSRTLMDRDQLEEERRLMYVAMTRAKERLFLSYARKRLFFGQRNSSSPSRFLSEIPERLVERENRATPAFSRRSYGDDYSSDNWESKPKAVSTETVQRLVSDDFDEIDSW